MDNWKRAVPKYQELMNYYNSSDWFQDVERSNKGEFRNMKAGILSQDAVYDLGQAERTLMLKMIRTALESLED